MVARVRGALSSERMYAMRSRLTYQTGAMFTEPPSDPTSLPGPAFERDSIVSTNVRECQVATNQLVCMNVCERSNTLTVNAFTLTLIERSRTYVRVSLIQS